MGESLVVGKSTLLIGSEVGSNLGVAFVSFLGRDDTVESPRY